MSRESINLFWLSYCHKLEKIVNIYLEPKLNPKRRDKADKYILEFLKHFNDRLPAIKRIAPEQPKKNHIWHMTKKVVLSILALLGVVHSVSAAFDGIFVLLQSFGMSTLIMSIACSVLGLFAVLLFFSYEMSKLARAFDLDGTINIPSRARELLRMQKTLASIRERLEALMRVSLSNDDLKSYRFYNRLYLDLLNTLNPLSQQIREMKQVKEGLGRKMLKWFLAILAGFLSGSVAYFDGFSLMNVINHLFSVTLPGSMTTWLPIIIGSMCFVVIMAVGIVSEGANLVRLIDEIRGRPFDVIHYELDTNVWEVSEYEEILKQRTVVQDKSNRPKVVMKEVSFQGILTRSDEGVVFDVKGYENTLEISSDSLSLSV